MKGELLTPYALLDGKLTHISEATKGLPYICAGCGSEIIVRKGEYIRMHFAHKVDSDCSGGGESVMHMMAKAAIAESKMITLPNPIPFGSPINLAVSSVDMEVPVTINGNKYVIDLVINSNGFILYVEVFYKHKTESRKVKDIRTTGIPTIEIKINDTYVNRMDTYEEILTQIHSPGKKASWIVSPVSEEIEGLIAEAKSRIEKENEDTIRQLKNTIDELTLSLIKQRKDNLAIVNKYISKGDDDNRYVGAAHINERKKARGINEYSVFLKFSELAQSRADSRGFIRCKMWKSKYQENRYPIRVDSFAYSKYYQE